MKQTKTVKATTNMGWVSLAMPTSSVITNAIAAESKNGWTVRQVMSLPMNPLAAFFIMLLLILTLFIWAPGRSYLIILEREGLEEEITETTKNGTSKEELMTEEEEKPKETGGAEKIF